MARRCINQNKDIIIKKATIDKDILIEKTPFKTNYKLVDCDMIKLCIDANDNIVTEYSESKTYSRKNFITIDNDKYDDIIRNLSLRAYKVFKYIKNQIPYNSNYIVLRGNTVLSIINDKYLPNAYKVIKELVDNDVISKVKDSEERSTYVINHTLFFKGSFNRFIYKYNKVYGESNDIEDANN